MGCFTRFSGLLAFLLIAIGGGVCSIALAGDTPTTGPAAVTTAPAALPRYWLPVGRHLVYSFTGTDTNVKTGKSTPSKDSTELTVVGDNPDGSKRLIVSSLDYVTIFPDGHTPGVLAPNDTIAWPLDSILPADENELKNGWTRTNEPQMKTMTYRPQGLDDKQFIFKSADSGMMDTIYSMTFERTFYFDRSRGVVTRMDSTNTQDYGFHTKGTGQTILETDEMIPLAAVRTLDQEVTAFQKARKAYRAAMYKAANAPPGNADSLYAKAKADMAIAALGATLPDVKAQYQAALADHNNYVRDEKDENQRQSAIIDKPAFDFSTKDIDGKPHKLSDYRGKVVVLDFWYRGCGWCMFAMPEIKHVADDFKDQPVVVMGMNVDYKDDDAKFVINAQKLNYPTLKSTFADAKKDFGVQGYPTLIVIDQQGVVRDIQVGYGPKLRDDVETAIRKLLKSPNTTS
jgi:peroxiredoxin